MSVSGCAHGGRHGQVYRRGSSLRSRMVPGIFLSVWLVMPRHLHCEMDAAVLLPVLMSFDSVPVAPWLGSFSMLYSFCLGSCLATGKTKRQAMTTEEQKAQRQMADGIDCS